MADISDKVSKDIEPEAKDEEKDKLDLPVDDVVLDSSHMVHSPTTDTLDSVILENLTTDNTNGEDEVQDEIKLDISETEDTQKTETPDLSIYVSELDIKDEPIVSATDPDEPIASVEQGAGNSNEKVKHEEQPVANISSYFSSEPASSLSSGAEFFDTITSPDTQSPPVTSPEPSIDAGPSVTETTIIDTDNSMIQQSFSDTHVEDAGETVEFEGEASNLDNTNVPVTEMEADDDFESFTAENSEVLSNTNLTITIENKPTTDTLTHQLSPLITQQQTGVDRQTLQQLSPVDSQTSAPPSPFHQFQTPAVPSVFDNFGEAGLAEDPFTASLCMSDSDRRHDAWIPSDATRHILISMASSVPGTYSPPVEHLCSPSVMITEPQGDPVRDLVFRYMGEQEAVKRHVLTSDSVSRDEAGLSKLVAAGCLRAAVDLTGYLLTDNGQGHGQHETGTITQHTPKTLQLWFCRFALLMRLRLYELLDSEMRAFNSMDSPDLYFEFYPQIYPGRRGSMVSFGLRILHAELPNFLGRNQESLDKLYYILAVTSKIVKNLENGLSEDGACMELSQDSKTASLKLWHSREIQVQYKIASVLLAMKDYEASITIFERLADKECENRKAIISGIGRIYLQMGNVVKATEVFKQVESENTKSGNAVLAMNSVNKGFLAMCVNNFSDAYEHFKSAVQLEPSNTCAVNNMAVCSLYMCRLKDALNTLEALVHNDPGQNLHEGILFNLCTLYELESSRALHKKQAVLDMVNKHKGDGFPIVCLKMS